LNDEFAADRLASIRQLADDCRRLGVVIPAATQGRITAAANLLQKADGARQGGSACAE
jgi:hypothetical protein